MCQIAVNKLDLKMYRSKKIYMSDLITAPLFTSPKVEIYSNVLLVREVRYKLVVFAHAIE